MEQAKFSFIQCVFTDIELHLQNATDSLTLQMHPEGYFDTDSKVYTLVMDFRALGKKETPDDLMVYVRSVSKFQLGDEITSIDTIPEYFYANSIAIMFPYMRALISSLTIQANTRPIVLPTMNLSSLGNDLQKNTKVL